MTVNENSTNRTMHRIFEVLEVLSNKPEGMTMSQISTHLNNPPKSSLFTLLQEMMKLKYLSYMSGEKKYTIGPALIVLCAVMISEHTVQKFARSGMEKLAKLTGEDIYLGIIDGEQLIYIDKVEGNQSVRLNIRIGAKRYLHSSCIGKLFMAYMDTIEQQRIIEKIGLPAVSKYTITNPEGFRNELIKIKETGISITFEESIEGIIGIAAPIRNHRREVVAGICISAPVSRVMPIQDDLIRMVSEIAQEISEQLGSEKSY
jgi:DNA-binding IclR family transcriptional regulator